MKLTGIADEAGASLDVQIKAHQELGWDSIESRVIEVEGVKGNLHEVPEETFDKAVEILEASGMGVCGFGAIIANWAHTIEDDFSITEAEISRTIPRMQRLGTKLVRVMSYAIRKDDDGNDLPDQMEEERFRRMREIQKRFADAGLTVVHENCMNYGGMGISHALKLLENVPGLKWVYDTGNPVFNEDRDNPGNRQDSWAFYEAVKPYIAHIHVKDGIWNPEKNDADYTFPGKGQGKTEAIMKDLVESGYDGYISIEPHVAVVFHGAGSADDLDPEAKAREQYNSYIQYGRELEAMLKGLGAPL
jgi:sugar phosphate isomerase/epimerase